MNRRMKKLITSIMIATLLIGLLSVIALADSGDGGDQTTDYNIDLNNSDIIPQNDDELEPMPEPNSNLPTSPREDPEVEIEVLPGDEPEIPNEEPPYVPGIDFPVIPPSDDPVVYDEPVVIEDEEIPLVEEPEIEEPVEEILDEDVPLADVPYTGSLSILWIVLSGLSAASLVLTSAKRKQ